MVWLPFTPTFVRSSDKLRLVTFVTLRSLCAFFCTSRFYASFSVVSSIWPTLPIGVSDLLMQTTFLLEP